MTGAAETDVHVSCREAVILYLEARMVMKTALYKKIYEEILEKIQSGIYLPGDFLPSEEKLCAQYKVSRMTVNKALHDLQTGGYILRKSGCGSYVSRARHEGNNELLGFRDYVDQRGYKQESIVMRHEVFPATKDLAQDFHIRIAAPILYLDRLRKINGVFVVFQESKINLSILKGLEHVDFAQASLYQSIKAFSQDGIAAAQDHITAVEADQKFALLLDVPVGFPLLRIERLGFLKGHKLIEKTLSWYRSDQYDLTVCYKASLA